jgi:hypothetical protein
MSSIYTTCLCCFVETPKTSTIDCDVSQHNFCYECTRSHVTTLMESIKLDVKCISTDECNGHFREQDFSKFMDKDLLNSFFRMQQRMYLRSAFGDNLLTCPFCSVETVQDGHETHNILICINPDCNKPSCLKCKKEFHWPDTCSSEHKHRIDKEERDTYSVIKMCPGCRVDVMRIDGCTHMHCTICATDFCYTCGEDITAKIWDHACPTWDNSNDSANMECPEVEQRLPQRDIVQEAFAEYRQHQHADISARRIHIRTLLDRIGPVRQWLRYEFNELHNMSVELTRSRRLSHLNTINYIVYTDLCNRYAARSNLYEDRIGSYREDVTDYRVSVQEFARLYPDLR